MNKKSIVQFPRKKDQLFQKNDMAISSENFENVHDGRPRLRYGWQKR